MSWIQAGKDGSRYELYAEMEERYGRGHDRKCINKKYTASCKCIGYCMYEWHPGFVTHELMKKHNCLERDCKHFLAKPKKIRGIKQMNG